MVESSFSPVTGVDITDDAQGLSAHRLTPAKRAVMRGAHLGFSQYVSSRTVLAGGCPAVHHEAVARASRRVRPGRD